MLSAENKAFDFSGLRLLVAEDNEINQQVTRELLEKVGVTVIIASNGQEAVEFSGKEHFDGILMDLQMPIMDGLTATKTIRIEKAAEALPIIAMTANAMAGDREKCLAVGMNDHISKPVDPDEMYATLAKWLCRNASLGSSTTDAHLPGKSPGKVLSISQIPGIDIIKGVRNVGGNATLYHNILLKFSKNQAMACIKMEQCLAAADFTTMGHIAHSLKGVSATIGALVLADLAGKIGNILNTSTGLEELPLLIGETAHELTRVISAIAAAQTQTNGILVRENHILADASIETLTPLFQRAIALLLVFDSAIKEVVDELALLLSSERRQKKLATIKLAVDVYEYETCLLLFQSWATEEGITY